MPLKRVRVLHRRCHAYKAVKGGGVSVDTVSNCCDEHGLGAGEYFDPFTVTVVLDA